MWQTVQQILWWAGAVAAALAFLVLAAAIGMVLWLRAHDMDGEVE